MDELKPLLQQLPEPAPPGTMAATIMARIEREAELRAPANQTARVPLRRERPVWVGAVVGVAVVIGVFFYGWSTGFLLPDVTSARLGMGRPSLMPWLDNRLSALLGAAFLIYLAGLFAPLRDRP